MSDPTLAEHRELRELHELRERDAHLRLAMQASNVVAYQWDVVNDRVTRLRSSSEPGTALEDAGNFESVVAKVHPDDQARFRADIAAALASPEGLYRTEVRYRRADGEVRWVSESGRVVRDASGRPVRMTGLTFDITDRKRAEEALQRAEAELRDEARRKDEFLAMLAHELRNPLAPIRNAAHIIRRLGPAEPAMLDAGAIIDRQVNHLVRLVDDLLDVSRVSRGKVALQLGAVDLRESARAALEVSKPLMDSRRHTLRASLPPEALVVRGDATRLAQVLGNLLNNAAKYTEPGGIVELTVSRAGAEAVASVRDNGCGIEPDALQRVFELFYQADRELDRAQGGLGLGLALVKSLVELHGGHVEARSAGRGAGSTFTLRLPAIPPDAPPNGGPE